VPAVILLSMLGLGSYHYALRGPHSLNAAISRSIRSSLHSPPCASKLRPDTPGTIGASAGTKLASTGCPEFLQSGIWCRGKASARHGSPTGTRPTCDPPGFTYAKAPRTTNCEEARITSAIH